MMEFEGEFTVDGTPEELWRYFTDPDILQQCAPGCEEMTLESPSEITATLAVGVGSVKPSFDVDAVVAECDEPDRLELRAGGEASRNSFEVTAWQELVDDGDGTTTVEWGARAEVSGIIASMGERALGSVANKLVNNFFEDLESCVNEGVPAESRLRAASEETLREAGFLDAPATDGDDVDEDAGDGDGDDDSGGLMDRLSRD